MHPLLVDTVESYLSAVDAAAPGLVEAVYLVGSAALGDWHPSSSDIDIVAVTAEPCTDDDGRALVAAHAALAADRPVPHVDGPYVAWADLTIEPATGLHRPWALDGEIHHDGECFEINPITWYMLARHGIPVRGPAPHRLGIALDEVARIRFVVDNLQTYWRRVAEQVIATLGSTAEADTAARDAARWTGEALVWCTLGPLRLHFTARTGEVTSKSGAASYGLTVLPGALVGVVERALELRGAPELVVHDSEMRRAAEVIDWVIDDVGDTIA
ncbi:MAG: nucleotidyltransferase domain-containing protein [Ilumatobacteraceae bacterium]